MDGDPQIKVLLFKSSTGFFLKHFDLCQAQSFRTATDPSLPTSVDLVSWPVRRRRSTARRVR
jgi:hypothetical protein